MNVKQKKLVKQIALVFAIAIAIIALQFGISRYIIKKNNETEVNFYEYRIAPNEIVISPETYTGGEVTVEITTQKQGLSIQYKLEGTDEWIDYTGPFNVDENVRVDTRLVSEADNFEGPITEKDIKNIAVAKIGDVYYKTLAGAIEACPENAGNTQTKIEMLANTTESVVIPEGKNIILDLCGNTVTSEQETTIVVNGKLNIVDSASNGTIEATTGTAIKVSGTGNLELGTNESEPNVNETAPIITGEDNGIIVEENGKFGFYDGIVSGKTNAINGVATDKPEGYGIVISEEGEYEVAKLKSTITVTFDANGGTASFTSKDVLTDMAYGSLPVVEEREGYSFLGWKTVNNQISTDVDDWESGAIDIAGNLTENNFRLRLKNYVKVSPNTQYILTTNTSELIIPRVILLYDKNYNLIKSYDAWSISVGSKYNIEFTTLENCEYIKVTLIKGHTTEGAPISVEDMTKANIELHATITENTKVIEENNHTLKAAWQAHEYTITYNANGGTGTIEDSKCTYDNNITIPQNTLTAPEGYTFKEWNTNPDGTGTKYEAGQEVKNLTSINNETINLYAIWEDKTTPSTTKPTGIGETNSITVNCNQTDAGSGIDEATIEYAIFNKDTNGDGKPDAWSDWQSSNVFEGLNANTEYEVKTRVTDKDGNGPVESEVGKISTSKIDNGTLIIKKDNEQGEVITPETNPDNQDNQVNNNLHLDITPSTSGTTTVTVKSPSGQTTTYTEDTTVVTETGKYEITVETTDGTNTVTDTYYVYVDKTNPTIEPTVEKVETNAIIIKANEKDTDSGVADVTYTIKKGDEIVASNKTGEFTGLEDDTEYTIEITVTDKAGNTTTTTESITTEKLEPGSILFTEASGNEFVPTNSETEEKVWINEDVNTKLAQGSAGTTSYEVTAPDGTKTTYTADTQITTQEGLYTVTVTTTDGTNTETVTYYFNVDKTIPTVSINPNTKEYTIAVGNNMATIGTTLTAIDNENGSGIAVTKYAWSTSKTEEPTSWSDFINATEVTKSVEGGAYYVWTNVEDKAGNKAVSVKTSGEFNVGYAVEFNANGGVGEIASQRKEHGIDLTITDEKPTRDMYIFKGWATSADSTTVEYTVNSLYKTDEPIRLYAVWSEVVASTTIDGVTTNYDSVQNAINAAGTNEGARVTLLKDEIVESVTVAAGQDIVLDTNGKTLTSDKITLYNYGDVVIDGTGTITTTENMPPVFNKEGNLRVINGNIIAVDTYNTAIWSTSSDDVIIGTENDTSTEVPHVKGLIYSEIDGDIYVHSGLVEGTTWRALAGKKNIVVTGGKITTSGTQEYTYTITGLSEDSVIKISGGIIESYSSIAVTTLDTNGGKIEISGGYIYSDKTYAVNNSLGETVITGGTITSGATAIRTTTGSLTITGGTIEATDRAITATTGEITIGTDDEETPSITTPRIIGGAYGIAGNILNFYDGIIIGSSMENSTIMNNITTNTPTGYRVINGTETIDGVERETAYIDNTYYITFDENCTNGTTSTIDKKYDSKLETLPTPKTTVTGYTFDGWYTDKTAGTKITENTLVNADITYYAHWVANTDTAYTVYHYRENANDANYELVETENLKGTSDASLTLANLSKAGKDNLANCTVVKTALTENGASELTTTIAPDGSTKVYVYYSRNNYKLEVTAGENVNAATGSGTYKWGQTINLTAQIESLSGYTYSNFAWNVETDGIQAKDVIADSTNVSTTLTMPASELKVSATANRVANVYNLTYNLNGGNMADGKTNPSTYTVEDEVKLNAAEKQGYVFLGWQLSTLDGQTVDNSPVVTTIPVGTIGNREYTAVFNNGEVSYIVYHYLENANDDKYTIYNTQSVDAKTGDVITLNSSVAIAIPNATYEKSTETEGGNQGTSITVKADSSSKIYVYYKRNTYTLNVLAGNNIGTIKINNEVKTENTFKYGATVNISAELANLNGYTYSNFRWETADSSILSSTTANETTVTMPAANTTVTAVADREVNTYNITYTLDGGTVAGENPITYTVESSNITLINPTKIGYTFTGWTGTGLSSATKNVIISTGSYGNRTYTANWEINKYTVTYDYATNGGASSEDSSVKTEAAKVEYNSAIDLTKKGTKANYNFVGWNTDKNATTGLNSLIMQTQNVTLYAIYAKDVTVKFDENGGAVDVSATYTMYNTNTSLEITMPEPTTNSGWEFNGYATTNNATLGEAKGTTKTITVAENTTTVTYYHTWKKQVTFNENKPANAEGSYNVTMNESSREVYYNNAFGTLPTNPTLPGWTFAGWYTAPNGGTQITKDTLAQDVPATIYAKWTLSTSISATPETVTLDLSNVKTQNIAVTGSNYGNVTYTTANNAVATVDENGVITVVGNGTTTITVTGSNGQVKDTITVTVVTTPTSVEISQDNSTIGVIENNTVQLNATIEPETSNEDNKITWTSSNSDVATVDPTTGVVTGVSEGKVTITVTTENGCTDTCEIIVDATAPIVAVSMDNANYEKEHTATITISDNVSGLPASQEISYAWSTSKDEAPESWETTTITVAAGATSSSTTVSTPSDVTGVYYLWVKSGIEDSFANATTENYINTQAPANLDNTAPVIALNGTSSPAKASVNSKITIPVKVTENHSGMNTTGTTQDCLTADDIEVKVDGAVVVPQVKELVYNSVSAGVYSYTLNLSGVDGTGDLSISINGGKIQDKAGNPNTSVTIQTGVKMDAESFSCTITANASNPTNASNITYTFTFNKEVNDFIADDIEVTNGTKGTFTKVSETEYTLEVTNDGTCEQTVSVKADSCTDTSGNSLEEVTPITIKIDRTAPTAPEVTVKADSQTGTEKGTVAAGNSGTVYTGVENNYLTFTATDDNADGEGKGTVVSYEISETADFAEKAVVASGEGYNFTATTSGKVYYVRTIDNVGNISNITTVTVKLVTLTVNPTSANIENEKTLAITANGVNAGTITWTSSDETIATVSTSGVVTAKKVGTVVITAQASTDKSVIAQSNVNVTKGIVEIPSAETGLVYNAQNQTGVTSSSNKYTITGNTASDAGQYKATVSLKDPSNYQWADGTTTNKTIDWAIEAKTLTATATADNKVYDGTTNVINGKVSLTGVIEDDTVIGTADFVFATSTVGNNKTINVTNITLAGEDAKNYKLDVTTTTTTANITKATLTATYVSEEITYGETPSLVMNVTGFVNGETAQTAAGYKKPTLTNTNTKVGTYTLKPTGGEATNYTFNYISGTLKINAKQLTATDIKASLADTEVTYNGKEQKPVLAVTDNGTPLTEGTDYDVVYTKNKDVGTAQVTITGKGNYSGTITLTFDIEPATLTATYAGEVIEFGETPKLKVEVTGFVNGETVDTAEDYVAPTVTSPSVAQGSYELVPQNGSAKNYVFNYVSGTLVINAKSNVTASLSQTEYTYDGTAKTPTVTVLDSSKELKEGTDYDVKYSNNVNAGTATVTITLKGNYSGTKTLTFTINKAQGTGSVEIAGYTYGETASTPVAASTTNTEVTYKYTGKTNAGANYESSAAPTQAGNYTVTATFADSANYKGFTATKDFVVARAVVVPTATVQNKVYDGTTQAVGTIALSGAKNNEEVSATATYNFENATAGENKVVNATNITLENIWKANYELSQDSVTTTANITKEQGIVTAEISNWVYGNTPSTPVVESSTNDVTNATYSYSGTTFGGESFGPSSEAPTQAGTYTVTVTVTGNENYEEVVVTKEVTVSKRTLVVSATANNKQYDGKTNATGNVVLTGAVSGENPTATGTFAFENATAGSGKTVYVTNIELDNSWKNNYELTTNTLTLTNGAINKATLTASYVSEIIDFGGTPRLQVLVEGFVNGETAATVAGYVAPTVVNTNTAVGSYELTPIGGEAVNYKFVYVKGTLTINASTNVEMTLSKTTYTYDGNVKEPTVTITDKTTGEVVSSDNIDKIEYINNINAGTATVKVTLKGSYSGTVSKTFTIEKAEREITVTSPVYVGVGANKDVAFTYKGTEGSDVVATVISDSVSIATVGMIDGNMGGSVKVTGITSGETKLTITVPTSANYLQATAEVNVVVTDFTVEPVSTVISKDGKVVITPTIIPTSVVSDVNGSVISWSSADGNIAKVSAASTTKGVPITVTGMNNGTVIITATLNGQSKNVEVKVETNYEETTSSGAHVNYYVTLADATANVTSGNTIKPLKDVEETERAEITDEKTVTVDLNGYTISNPTGAVLKTNGQLTIKGEGTISGATDAATVLNSGTKTLTVLSGEIKTSGMCAIAGISTGKIVIGTEGNASTTSPKITGSITGQPADIYVHSGSITATTGKAVNSNGNITITGGYIKSADENQDYTVYGNTANSVITITGGTIEQTGNIYAVTTSNATEGAKVNISGGKIIANSNIAVNNHKGEITITGGEITAKSGVYTTSGTVKLSGGTITTTENAIEVLTGNVEVSGTANVTGSSAVFVRETGTATVKENATLTGTTAQGLRIGDGTGVVTGGTIKGETDGIYVVTGNVTIEGGTVEGNTQYGIQVVTGQATVLGGTVSSIANHGIYANGGILTLGSWEETDTDEPSTTAPTIIGGTNSNGVRIENGTFNFYDGVIEGREGGAIATTETTTNIPIPDYGIQKTNADGRQTAILVATNYQEVTSTGTHVNYYATLADATAKVTSGNTIKPLKDVEETERAEITDEKTVTVDLNGYTISNPTGAVLKTNGQLTIKGEGTISGATDAATVLNSGTKTLTVLSGEIRTAGIAAVAGISTGKVVIGTEGNASTTSPKITGSITGQPADIYVHSGSITATTGKAVNSNGNITITGGYIKSADENQDYTVYGYTANSVITITGGTIEQTGNTYAVTTSNSIEGAKVNISGGKIIANSNIAVNNYKGEITITGGEITAKSGVYTTSGTVKLSGGTITTTENAIEVLTGNVEVSGTANITGSVGIFNNSTGTVAVAGNAKVTGTSAQALRIATGNVTVSGGTINGKTDGIYVTTGEAVVTGGNITAVRYGTYVSGAGKLTIGVKDGIVSTESPSITSTSTTSGSSYAVNVVEDAVFNYYDGKLEGLVAIKGTVDEIQTPGYEIQKTIANGKQTAILVATANALTLSETGATTFSLRRPVSEVQEQENIVNPENTINSENTELVEEEDIVQEDVINEETEIEQEEQTQQELPEIIKLVQIGENTYETLQLAIDSANNEDEIMILQDIVLTEEVTILENKNVKLNLNNKTISSSSENVIKNNGTLTITKSGIIRNETSNGTVIYNTGILNIENGIITTAQNGGKAVFNDSGTVNMISGKIVTEGISGIGIYNVNTGKVLIESGIIEVTGSSSKCIYNDASLEITGGKIVVSGDDSIGIYNLDKSTQCIMSDVEILVEAEVIENYELIKNTEEFKAELEQMKPSYGIYNNSEINVEIETATIKVERLKGVGIFNKLDGSVTLGIEDSEVSTATPIVYAISDNTTAIVNSENGNINFYDGRLSTLSSIKDVISKVLDGYELVEEIGENIVNATLKVIEVIENTEAEGSDEQMETNEGTEGNEGTEATEGTEITEGTDVTEGN